MKTRIALWATGGALVVVFWRFCIMATRQHPLPPGGMGRALVHFTCPITLAGNRPQTFCFVLIVNAATYALAGAIVEAALRHHRIHSISD